MKDSYLNQMESNVEKICKIRKEIADLKEEKITKRSRSWETATGTAKEKEDYVRSMVANIDKKIAYCEAEIEYLYNKNNLLNDKLVFFEDE